MNSKPLLAGDYYIYWEIYPVKMQTNPTPWRAIYSDWQENPMKVDRSKPRDHYPRDKLMNTKENKIYQIEFKIEPSIMEW